MQEEKEGVKAFYAPTRAAWRKWLQHNHGKEQSVWLIIYKKESGKPSVYYPEAVDEALCFGWVDSKPNKRDQDSYYQFFARRNPKSNWSKINKEKVSRLIQNKLMMPAGLEMVAIAKKTGTWDALNEVEAMIIPEDLSQELEKYDEAGMNFDAFPPSTKKGILEWILNAKRTETRRKRVQETAALAQDNIRANQYKAKSK